MSLLILLLVSINSVFVPDPATTGVKIVTRQVSGGFSDTRTEYLTENRLRSEWQTHVGELTGPPMVSIVQRGPTNRVFLMDLQAREYVTYETDSQGSALGARPRSLPFSGGLLQIWIDNIDTGERLLMFGHMARHIITREKRIASPGACSRSSESETDGWYIDDALMPEWNRQKKSGAGVVVTSAVPISSASACYDRMDTIQVHRTGTETGFPLKITTTMKSEVPSLDGGARLVASNWGSEVMEFKEGPLDPALFDVPADFHRVDNLKNWTAPPPRRQLTGWEWFKEKLSELFQ